MSDLDNLLADLTPAEDEAVSSTETDEGATPDAGSEAETSTETEDKDSDEPAEKPEGEETEEDETEEEAPKPKKPSGSERLRRRLERAEAELADLRNRRPVAAGDDRAAASAIEAEIGPPPKESDFDDFMAYERALTAYETEKRIVGREMKARASHAETQARERQAELIEDHTDRLGALEKRLPGSLEKIRASTAEVAPTVVGLLLESEKSAHLQLYLTEHPDKLADLNRMSERQAAREIGRLEARLSLPKPRTETKAPPPVRAVKGAAAPTNHDTELSAWLTSRYGR